jgi:hypothetical protein
MQRPHRHHHPPLSHLVSVHVILLVHQFCWSEFEHTDHEIVYGSTQAASRVPAPPPPPPGTILCHNFLCAHSILKNGCHEILLIYTSVLVIRTTRVASRRTATATASSWSPNPSSRWLWNLRCNFEILSKKNLIISAIPVSAFWRVFFVGYDCCHLFICFCAQLWVVLDSWWNPQSPRCSWTMVSSSTIFTGAVCSKAKWGEHCCHFKKNSVLFVQFINFLFLFSLFVCLSEWFFILIIQKQQNDLGRSGRNSFPTRRFC